MKRANVASMKLGWFIGNFQPSIFTSENFEVCIKRYAKSDKEPRHFQHTAVEVTLIVSGQARMGNEMLNPDDIILIEPGEKYDFEALTDVVLVAIKTPSIPNDKELA